MICRIICRLQSVYGNSVLRQLRICGGFIFRKRRLILFRFLRIGKVLTRCRVISLSPLFTAELCPSRRRFVRPRLVRYRLDRLALVKTRIHRVVILRIQPVCNDPQRFAEAYSLEKSTKFRITMRFMTVLQALMDI